MRDIILFFFCMSLNERENVIMPSAFDDLNTNENNIHFI